MALYAAILISAVLAVYVQWKDGLAGYGNTTAGLQLARALWLATAVFTGMAVDRRFEAGPAILAGFCVYAGAAWVTRRLEAVVLRHGPDPHRARSAARASRADRSADAGAVRAALTSPVRTVPDRSA